MLSIKNISIEIEKKLIVSNFSLELSPSTLHVLLGPNGAGKSSIAQILLGNPLYSVVDGSCLFQGTDLLSLEPHERARQGLCIVQQESIAIPGLSVAVYLKAIYDALDGEPCQIDIFLEKVRAIFTYVGLDHAFIDRSVHEGFSGGQKKRFELAQVLLCQPKCVIFDEVDAGLDEAGRQLLINVIETMRHNHKDFSALFISHNYHLYTSFTDVIVHELMPYHTGLP
ncbi:MAG TPA: ATP-binding cassette domain-containing protein [Patescibacteria group bacterium]|jgi:Fe-S cluster assembly ATP-binding protein|nr:ATP-binding cassette domain-containing protein [Patescibacteria group bacterium]